MAARRKASRHDNPELVRGSSHCEHTFVIAMERSDRSNLIASNTCFLGLLRYARNDKSQDGREAQGLSP